MCYDDERGGEGERGDDSSQNLKCVQCNLVGDVYVES